MSKYCPDCGLSFEDDTKFCAGCGKPLITLSDEAKPADEVRSEQPNTDADEPMPADPAPAESVTVEPVAPKSAIDEPATVEPAIAGSEASPEGERVFIMREKKYGDTDSFDDLHLSEKKPDAQKAHALRASLSLYFSIFAVVLSLAAMALVIIFVIGPSGQRQNGTEISAATEATAAPTQAPTDPPITGGYSLTSIQGGDAGLMTLMFTNSRLEVSPDYTGTLSVGGSSIGSLTMDKNSDTAVMLNKDCTYHFDGRVLTLDYSGLTLVYKKD